MSVAKRPGRSQEQSLLIVEGIASLGLTAIALTTAAAQVWPATVVLSLLGLLYASAAGRTALRIALNDEVYRAATAIQELLLDHMVKDSGIHDEIDRLERGDY